MALSRGLCALVLYDGGFEGKTGPMWARKTSKIGKEGSNYRCYRSLTRVHYMRRYLTGPRKKKHS